MKRQHVIAGVLILILVVVGVAVAYIVSILNRDQIPLGTPGGEIAFMSDRNGDWDLFIVDSDGEVRNLTGNDTEQDYFPSFAFDSNMINFLTSRDNDDLAPGQVTPDGEELATLSIAEAVLAVVRTGRIDWDPNWLPNSDQILFASLRDLNLEIYVSDTSGEGALRLTRDGANDWFPTISPDGTQLLFLSDREDGVQVVYRMDIDGENMQQLTDNQWDNLHPTWSRDGDKILFIRDVEDALLEGTLTLYTMNPDGSDQQPLGEGEVFAGDLNFSPDNGQVTYMSNDGGFWHIYVMDADGSSVKRITEGEHNNLFPVWRPNPLEQG